MKTRIIAFLNFHRRIVAAVCAALCVAGVVSMIQARPVDGEPVVALARDVAAGHQLAPEDLKVIEVPSGLVSEHTVIDKTAAIGAVLTIAGDADAPLNSHALLHDAAAAKGSALVPISVPDDDLRALLHPGQIVTLIVALDGAPETVTDKARIAKLPSSGDSGFGGHSSRMILVEVPSGQAHVVATLGQAGQLGVILDSR